MSATDYYRARMQCDDCGGWFVVQLEEERTHDDVCPSCGTIWRFTLEVKIGRAKVKPEVKQ